MIFGDSKSFAIEAIVEPQLVAPSEVWGRMQLIVCSHSFGDINNEHCGLYGAYCGFKALMSHRTQLWHGSFDGLDDKQIHDIVRHAIYGDDTRTADQIQQDLQNYRMFDFLTNWGELFDQHPSVIFQRHETQTTIVNVNKRSDRETLSLSFDTRTFRSATMEFLAWFDSVAERLSQQKA